MKTTRRGFTLIEMLIAIAVLAILAAIAIPNYSNHVRKSTRAEAQAFLLAVAGRQQQFLVDTRAYGASYGAIGIPTPANVAAAYTLSIAAAAGPPPTFLLTATPKASQASEKCGTLSINQDGTRTAALGTCW